MNILRFLILIFGIFKFQIVFAETQEFLSCQKSAAHPKETDNGSDWDSLNSTEAIKICNKALNLDPQNKSIRRYLARALFKNEKYKKSLDILEKLSNENDAIANYYIYLFTSNEDFETAYNLQKANNNLKLSSERGFSEAQEDMLINYFYGYGGFDQDYEVAFNLAQKLSNKNNDWGLYFLGDFYEDGIVVKQDYKKAIEYYELSAEQGNYFAQYAAALIYSDGEGESDGVPINYEKALELFTLSAEQGFYRAQMALWGVYSKGESVEIDYKRALDWLQKSADQGWHEAYNNFGYLYYYGEQSLDKDYGKAYEFFKKAADDGNVKAIYSLGVMYENGEAVDQNYSKAMDYFLLADEQDYYRAPYSIGYLYEHGLGVEASYEEAFKWYEKGSELGDPDANVTLGWNYQNGIGKPRDFELSMHYYEQANDDPYALDNIGLLYLNGLGVEGDIFIASEFFEKSLRIDPEHPWSSYNLGKLLVKDILPDSNQTRGLKLLENSAKYGNSHAALELSEIYKFGMYGIGQDTDKAIEFSGLIEDLDELDKKALANYLPTNIKQRKMLLLSNLESSEQTNNYVNQYGNYHAIIIGNNNYESLLPLKTAINDATELSKVLEENYYFKPQLLIDASRSEILKSIRIARKTLKEEDNLLIYYAGHGYLDEEINKGYWQPVNAEKDDPTNWISNSDIIDQLAGIKSKHIIIVADSCFSGSLTRGLEIVTEDDSDKWINKIKELKARTVLTSGNLEPVSDGGKNNHSVFAYYLLDALNKNENIITGDDLYDLIKKPIVLNSDQTPLYSELKSSGSEGGDFIFVRNN